MYSSGFRSLLRGRASPAVSAIAIAALFLLAALLVGVASGLPALPGGARSSSTPALSSAPASAPAAAPPAPVHPLGTVQRESGVFYENNTTFANLPLNRTPCGSNQSVYNYTFTSPPYTYYENYLDIYDNCYAGGQSPSTLSLGGNDIGIGYSVLSNQSMVGCSNHPDVETSQVAFVKSSDAGATYGPPVWIGNTTCAYLQALEPSFTYSSNGHIYGAFVEANYGNATNKTFPFNYNFRTDDALAFTQSGTLGTRFSTPVTLSLAGTDNIARPEIAAFGKSIYIVYENLNNNSSILNSNAYPYAPSSPISLEMVSSLNGGTTWSGPVTLPGLNASAGYNAMSPSIAVSTHGTVAVAYATNRSCFESIFGTCENYGDNIVVSTSSSNGTSWTGPVQVSPNATGEYQCAGWENYSYSNTGYWYSCYAYLYSWQPSTSVAWSTVSPNDLYVAWSGEFSFYNASDLSSYYGTSSVFTAASNDSGAAWNDSTVAENSNQIYAYAYYYNPVINDRDGWVYVSYAEENDSYCYPCTPGTEGSSYWLATSHDGDHWMHNVTLLLWNQYAEYTDNAFVAYTESMGFSDGGPVITFSQPAYDTYGYGYVYTDITQGTNIWFNDTDWQNTTGFADLSTVFVWGGNTTEVNFTETGLAAGTTWNFSLGSATFSSDLPTIQVTDVPVGPGLPFTMQTLPNGYWTEFVGFSGINSTPTFTGPTNVTVHFVVEYGVEFYDQPSTNPDFEINFNYNGTFYYYENCCGGYTYENPEFPWYFPVGTVLTILPSGTYTAYPISYWSGTGNGSSNNFGNSTTITVNGVINETAWAGAFGSYTLTFSSVGLPSGTTYNFTFDGTSYSGVSPANVTVPNVVTGAYVVSGISAPASGGYEYFGQVQGGDTVYIPATPVVLLNYSYAYVDVASPPGTVSFQASGLAVGDPWQLAFNGTTYSSSTPWINITTRPGTFAVAAFPIEAAYNDTAEYSPTGVGPTQAVTLGSTYAVDYQPTYRAVVVAATGGTVTGAGSHWYAPGTLATYTAHANPNYIFLGWSGTGDGSYTGTSVNASVTVNGPITESASFGPPGRPVQPHRHAERPPDRRLVDGGPRRDRIQRYGLDPGRSGPVPVQLGLRWQLFGRGALFVPQRHQRHPLRALGVSGHHLYERVDHDLCDLHGGVPRDPLEFGRGVGRGRDQRGPVVHGWLGQSRHDRRHRGEPRGRLRILPVGRPGTRKLHRDLAER